MNSASNTDLVFPAAVKAAQEQRGSREMYARPGDDGGFPSTVTESLSQFIAERDSLYFGTASRDGQPYIQHRGGPKGFLKVLDENTLAFGDIAGNRQYISVGNLDENPGAFIFLIDYPNRRRIKIWGTAQVIEDDPELLRRVHTEDDPPQRVFVFRIGAWSSNCPKNIRQRWTSDELDERIQDLNNEVEQLRRENRELKAATSK